MKSRKVRLQLFLPKDQSDRLTRIAEGTGRARSEIVTEAVEAFLLRRNNGSNEEGVATRLTRLERRLEAVQRHQTLQWELLARMLRHQLLVAAGLPRAEASQLAAAAEAFEKLLDEIAERVAGKEGSPTTDPGLMKIRSFG